jgi:uncharacterized protein YbjT (DUF2867 family)
MRQPIAAGDVAAALADVAVGDPVRGTIEVAGPEPMRLADLAREVLRATGDDREVIADPHARYFGAELTDESLVPASPRVAPTRFHDWLAATTQREPQEAG